MTTRRVAREAQINIRVHPQVKRLWEQLPEAKKKILIKKFQMDIVGALGEELPEGVADLPFTFRYDKESLKMLSEFFGNVLSRIDEEVQKREEVLKAYIEWEKEVKKFLKSFVEAQATALCEYGGLGSYKSKAKELLEEAP